MLHNGQSVSAVTFNGQTVNKVFYNGSLDFINSSTIQSVGDLGLPTSSADVPDSDNNRLTTMLIPQNWDGTSSTVTNAGYYGDYSAINVTQDSNTGAFVFTDQGATTGNSLARLYGPWFHSRDVNDITNDSAVTHKKAISMWVKADYDSWTVDYGGIYASHYKGGGAGAAYNSGSTGYLYRPGSADQAAYAIALTRDAVPIRGMYNANDDLTNGYYVNIKDHHVPAYEDWNMVTFVFNEDEIRLFRNDIEVGRAEPYPNSFGHSSTTTGQKFQDHYGSGSGSSEYYFKRKMTLGCNAYYSGFPAVDNFRQPFFGMIGHVFAWSGAILLENDVQQLYNSTRQYYDQFRSEVPLDLSSATPLYDSGDAFDRRNHSFDDSFVHYIMDNGSYSPVGFVGADLGTAKAVRGYRLMLPAANLYSPIGSFGTHLDTDPQYSTEYKWPKDWTFEGSNDNTNWTVLDTVTDAMSLLHSSSQYDDEYGPRGTSIKRLMNNQTSYRYYRLNVTANTGHAEHTVIGELEMFGF